TYGDSTVIDKLNNGEVDATRMSQYADWVELLFEYSDQTILKTGTYDDQVQKFDSGHAAFIHQGNWIDPNLDEATFTMGYAPHASVYGTCDSIFIAAPSYYVINSDSENIDTAKLFLNDLASTTAGMDYTVNQAGMISAFKSCTLLPSGGLSQALVTWMNAGKAYSWWQNDMPSNFGMGTLGPIYTLYANGTIDKTGFITQITAAIEALAPEE
nr:extracellular solute-binding protein [Bacillota bacterium]